MNFSYSFNVPKRINSICTYPPEFATFAYWQENRWLISENCNHRIVIYVARLKFKLTFPRARVSKGLQGSYDRVLASVIVDDSPAYSFHGAAREIVLRVPLHPEEDLWFDVISSVRGIRQASLNILGSITRRTMSISTK